MKRRRWLTIGLLLMTGAAGWLLREFWLPWLPVWGEGLKVWADEWGTTVQTLTDILASVALIGGGLTAWLGLRGRGEGGLPSIFVTMPDAERAGVQRSEMRATVRRMWVEGVLHKSLYQEVRIELGKERLDEAVSQRPWQRVIHLPDQADRSLPQGTQLWSVFEEANRSLLILGEPGAGKTTELLALVEQVLDGQEPTSPAYVPVVFNLSSWAEKRLPLDKWLVEELQRNYGVSRRLAESWVAEEALGLFLDGLDEVAEEARAGCVAAINAYREEHGSVPVCVCCRRAEYGSLGTPLALIGAVVLSPLTRAEVEGYLDGLGSQVEGLAQALTRNESLWELAETPLGLNILAMTYHGMSRAEVEDSLRGENLERQLFAAYVEQTFVRPARIDWVEPVRYTREDTMRWLGWLAYQMRRHNQTLFLIERLQPDWCSGPLWRSWLIVGVLVGLYAGGIIGLLAAMNEGLVVGLRYALFGGLAGFFVGLTSQLHFGVVVMLAGVLAFLNVLTGALIGGLAKDISDLALGGLLLGVVLHPKTPIKPAEVLALRWDGAGVFMGLFGGLLSGLFFERTYGLQSGLVAGVLTGTMTMLLSQIERQPLTRTSQPNQGIRQSMRNGLIAGLTVGSFSGMMIALVAGIYYGLLAALAIGLGVSLLLGCSAVVRHVILQLTLYWEKSIPVDYIRFLDYTAERIILRKVGGGYIFAHGLLLNYLADRYEERTFR